MFMYNQRDWGLTVDIRSMFTIHSRFLHLVKFPICGSIPCSTTPSASVSHRPDTLNGWDRPPWTIPWTIPDIARSLSVHDRLIAIITPGDTLLNVTFTLSANLLFLAVIIFGRDSCFSAARPAPASGICAWTAEDQAVIALSSSARPTAFSPIRNSCRMRTDGNSSQSWMHRNASSYRLLEPPHWAQGDPRAQLRVRVWI